MSYLQAVVLEGLRRHPPGHFILSHTVTKDVELEGYQVPKGAMVNFMVAEMGCDPKVWDEPMEFKPERFLINRGRNGGEGDREGEGEATVLFDITGSKEIKMMPFGPGGEYVRQVVWLCFTWNILWPIWFGILNGRLWMEMMGTWIYQRNKNSLL
ncbi:unnamed protein product [Camellia sinensis]